MSRMRNQDLERRSTSHISSTRADNSAARPQAKATAFHSFVTLARHELVGERSRAPFVRPHIYRAPEIIFETGWGSAIDILEPRMPGEGGDFLKLGVSS